MNHDELHILFFLRFGYFCDYEVQRAPIDFSKITKGMYEGASREDLLCLGVEKLQETFTELWQEGREHVLPLSGGLDSRLILGALLEHTDAERLQTFTFGVAGSYDYEIGKAIAKKLGTQHLPIPLGDGAYSLEEELSAARRTDCQGLLFHHPPLGRLDRLYRGALFWSGYVGDAVAGSHLQMQPSATLLEAQPRHLRNRVFVRSTRLHRCAEHEFLVGMREASIDPELLTLDEQVLFNEAVPKFTAPLVLFHGYDFVTPLINTPWMNFMLSVPNSYRFGGKLMIDIGRRAYPEIFGLPSKNLLGHGFDTPDSLVRATFWMNRVRKLAHQFVPSVNYPCFQYNDFNEGIRNDPSLRRIVKGAIERLRLRGVCDWVDFDGIWKRHDWRLCNHGDALIVLASLEIVLEAREQKEKEV